MPRVDPQVLSGVGLGLDHSAFGWPPGVGLRWTLPAATTRHTDIRDAAPRGWPDDGYWIYRQSLDEGVARTCVRLDRVDAGRSTPLTLDRWLTVDWVPVGEGRLDLQLAASGAAVLYVAGAPLFVELAAAPLTDNPARAGWLRVAAYDRGGRIVCLVNESLSTARRFLLDAPGIVRVELGLESARVEEVCVGQRRGKPDDPPAGRLVAQVKPLTDVEAILAVVPTARRGERWELFAAWLRRVLADVDARTAERGTGPSDAEVAPTLETPLADLFVIASLDPTIARLLGLLYWDESAYAGSTYLYTVAASWRGEGYVWTLPPLWPTTPRRFRLPAGLVPAAALETPTVSLDRPPRPATAVALRWRNVDGIDLAPARPVDTPAQYVVRRSSATFETSPEARAAQFADDTTYQPVEDSVLVASRLAAGAVRLRDVGIPEGHHAWAVTGLDVFGRPSEPVASAPLEVWDVLPPPRPASIRGAFLDAAALTDDGTSDPLLTAEHVAWLRANPTVASALYVGFQWPAAAANVAPTAREFRVYWQPAAGVPRVVGTIAAVALEPDGDHCAVTLSVPLVGSEAAYEGGTLTDGGAAFDVERVLASTPQARVRVRVQRGPRRFGRVTDPLLGERLIESIDPPDAITPSSGRGCTLVANLRSPSQWSERLAIVPRVPPLATSVHTVLQDRVEDGGFRVVTLQLADRLEHPAPAAGVFLEGGQLELPDGVVDVAAVVVLDARRELPAGGLQVTLRLPAAGGLRLDPGTPLTYHSAYALYLAHASFRPTGAALAYGLVSATAANASHAPGAADVEPWASDRRWREAEGPRRGFESATAAPALVVAVKRATPGAPRTEGDSLAGWPDAAGRAAYSVRWTPEPGLRYVVHRAADTTVFAVDRELRARDGAAYARDERGESGDLGLLTAAAVFPDPGSPGATNYDAITDASLLRRIASLAGNAGAFKPLASTALGVDDLTGRDVRLATGTMPGVVPPGMWRDLDTGDLVYGDTLPGIGTGRFFYRVEAIDSAGNRSELGPSTAPVALRVTAMPRTPAPQGVRTGVRSLTVLWPHPEDDSVDRYAVYCANSPAEAGELELRAPSYCRQANVALRDGPEGPDDLVIEPPPIDPSRSALQWGATFSGLRPMETTIAIVAERVLPSGIVLRSAPATLRATPRGDTALRAPRITRVARDRSEVVLEWEVAQASHEVLAEYRRGDDGVWRTALSWSHATLVMLEIEPTEPLDVRLRARDASGVTSAPELQHVDPAE